MKLVYGFGVNDANYAVNQNVGGERRTCPSYRAWKGMLERCYSKKRHSKHKTYSGVTVCDEWRSFMAFREWWLAAYVDGWELDKDLISSDRVYGPSSCVYVPSWVNNFTTDSGSKRGQWPIGVDFCAPSGRFRARCRNPVSGKAEHLGLFLTPELAGKEWMNRKLELALELKQKFDEIDLRIYPRVIEIIATAR